MSLPLLLFFVTLPRLPRSTFFPYTTLFRSLALYQLTSLLLGPVSSRQLDLSLTIPAAVEVQDRSEPMMSTTNVVVGTRATPAAPPSRAMRVVASPRAASVPIPKASSRPLPTVLPTPNPHPADKKRPVD